MIDGAPGNSRVVGRAPAADTSGDAPARTAIVTTIVSAMTAATTGETRTELVQRAQRFGVRDDHLAALGLDQPLALERRERERHGLAGRADQVGELLVRDLEGD